MRSFAADLCNKMHITCPLLRANNTLTLIYSCKRHFCLPFNKATLLVTLPFLVIPLSRMFSFFEDAGGLSYIHFPFMSQRNHIGDFFACQFEILKPVPAFLRTLL